MVLQFKTNGFNCYGVAFSPHHPRRLGCVSAQNYGIAGSGALYDLEMMDTLQGPQIRCNRLMPSNGDPLYDLC
ncbi:unnamed protein product, partial [Medioppia subpectinata]